MSFLTASHHTRAFNYESIRDQQEAIEMWRDLAIGGGLLLLGLFCPPAGGFVLAASLTMSAADMYSATTGKDWGTGRELSTEERILRGGFALLELVPGIGYLNDVAKSGGKVAVKNVVKNSLREGFEQGAKNFDNIVKFTSKFGDNVLSKLDDFGRQADQVFNKLASKGADSLSTGLKNVDQGLSQAAQNFRLNMGLEPQLVSGAMPSPGSSSINKITNKLDDFSKARKLRISDLDEVGDTILRDGSHFDEFGKLKPNVRYQAGEYEYLYRTDDLGRLQEWDAQDLQLTQRSERFPHAAGTPGKLKGDHAGHLAGDRFGGSPELDNLVSQLQGVNLSDYKKLENQWAKALEEGKKVSVQVRVNYVGDSLRPSSFDVNFSIDGIPFTRNIKN